MWQDLYIFNYSVIIVFPPRFAIKLACLIVAFLFRLCFSFISSSGKCEVPQIRLVILLPYERAKLLNTAATGPDLAFTGTTVVPLCTCSCTSVCFRVKPFCFLTVMPKWEAAVVQAKPADLRPSLWCKLRNSPIINVDALEVPGDYVCLYLRGCSSRFLCIDLLMQVQVDSIIRCSKGVSSNYRWIFQFFTTLYSKDKKWEDFVFLFVFFLLQLVKLRKMNPSV